MKFHTPLTDILPSLVGIQHSFESATTYVQLNHRCMGVPVSMSVKCGLL